MDHFPARPLRRHPVAPDSASRLGGDPRYRAQPIADRPIGRRAHPICLHRPAAQAALPYLRAGVDSDGDFLLAKLDRTRVALGLAALAIFLLTFMLAPLR